MINIATFTHIFRTYKPITTYDQRCQYERDFPSKYLEYVELKKNVDEVAMKFIELGRSWRRTEKGSDNYFVSSVYIIRTYWQFLRVNLYVIKKFVYLKVLFYTILAYFVPIFLFFFNTFQYSATIAVE